MAKERLHKTLADYVAIAISPALIMVLVGSLVFFLLEVSYRGELAGRFGWVLFWFVFAAVLIARIAIEQGNEHAAVYTVAFWGATSLVVFRFIDQPVFGLLLLGVAWWCAKKLTWDCTLIDDAQDASGQGLLQISGLDPNKEPNSATTDQAADKTSNGKTPPKPAPALENSTDKPTDEPADKPQPERPHAPGLWVVYFSLAALPLFGLGQLLIPAANTGSRATAFRYLWCYVAAGLGLLLTTSFLGLRRYLRQRNLAMPGRMTGGWIGQGAGLALGILILCLLLPRPNATHSLKSVVNQVSTKIGEASEHAFGSDDAGKGEGRNVGREAKEDEAQPGTDGQKGNHGEQPGETSKSDQPASGGKGKKDGSSSSKGGKQTAKGNQQENNSQSQSNSSSKQQQSHDKQAEENGKTEEQKRGNARKNDPNEQQADSSGSSKPNSSRPLGSLADKVAGLVKWIIYAVLGVMLAIALLRHWSTIWAGLLRLLVDLRNFWAGLWGRKPATRAQTLNAESKMVQRPIRPFADYPNPFRTGTERDMGTLELIQYTYDALQAWGAEQGCPKRPDQTPTEYAHLIAAHAPQLTAEARQVALLYLRAAFSTSPPTIESHQALKRAWSGLERAPSTAF